MRRDSANPHRIPVGGWVETGDLRGLALPTLGTAAALIELYRGKSGGRDAETSVTWSRGVSYVSFSSDRGPDVISVLRRAGDEGIHAFVPPQSASDTLFLYLRQESTRRAWAVARASRGGEDLSEEDPQDDAGSDAAGDEDQEDVADTDT